MSFSLHTLWHPSWLTYLQDYLRYWTTQILQRFLHCMTKFVTFLFDLLGGGETREKAFVVEILNSVLLYRLWHSKGYTLRLSTKSIQKLYFWRRPGDKQYLPNSKLHQCNNVFTQMNKHYIYNRQIKKKKGHCVNSEIHIPVHSKSNNISNSLFCLI